jgi:CspA family cold shock protein
VHVTGLNQPISENDEVEFELQEGKKGLNAVNVSAL